jgi:hypothetical protein
MASVTVDQPDGVPPRPPASLLEAIDRWLHHPAIHRALLVVCLAAMTSLVLIVVLGGPGPVSALLGLAGATTASGYIRARRTVDLFAGRGAMGGHREGG